MSKQKRPSNKDLIKILDRDLAAYQEVSKRIFESTHSFFGNMTAEEKKMVYQKYNEYLKEQGNQNE